MRRVRQNIERLLTGLTEQGYDFAKNRDGSPRQWRSEPHSFPTPDTSDIIGEIEAIAGRLPLSLFAFWETVGGIDLTGYFPGQSWPQAYGPLQVWQAKDFLTELLSLKGDFVHLKPGSQEPVVFSIEATGNSLTVALPATSEIDFMIVELSPPTTFVSYLRTAFQWAGFPGLARFNNYPTPPEILTLRQNLLPF